MENGSETRLVQHSEGESHPVMGDPMRFIMTAAHSGGAYAIAEQEVRPGNGAPPHIHHKEDESFYVLEGSFSVLVGDQLYSAHAGDFIHIPRGAVRGFTNVGSTAGRVLILHVPGSASGFYIGMGKLPFPPKLEDIAALGNQHGIEIVLPKP
jgi:quercetin dioxygenase-like cupin family protein